MITGIPLPIGIKEAILIMSFIVLLALAVFDTWSWWSFCIASLVLLTSYIAGGMKKVKN